MANVFQSFRKDGTPHPNYRYHYTKRDGRQGSGTGTTCPKQTLEMARQREWEEKMIAAGRLAVPEATAPGAPKPLAPLVQEFLNRGRHRGGRRGHPRSEGYARGLKRFVEFWVTELKLKTTADVANCRRAVERATDVMLDAGKSKKTTQDYISGLRTFCGWLEENDLIPDNPLRKVARLNTEPSKQRRPAMAWELAALRSEHAGKRRLGYLLALTTGLRANECGALRVRHLNVARGGVHLQAEWTKNRQRGFQLVPRWLVQELAAAADGRAPEDALVYVSSHGARELRKDLKAFLTANPDYDCGSGSGTTVGADGVPEVFDFHACRVTFATMCDEAGATRAQLVHAMRVLAPDIALGRYVKIDEDALRQLVEAVGARVLGLDDDREAGGAVPVATVR